MKTYIKGGIVTKISILSNNKDFDLSKYFDLNMFNKIGANYYLKEDFLNLYIKDYYKELLSLTNGDSDSLSNSDAYILNTTVDKLLNNKIYLLDNNEKYYFKKYYRMRFETDYIIEDLKKVKIAINMITVIWNIDKTITENSLFFSILLNNLIRKIMSNKLKDVTWFTITN